MQLKGKVALVTGAGVGLGEAIALALGGAGAIVGIHYHSSRAGAEAVKQKIEASGGGGGKGILLQADLTDEKQARAVVDSLVAQTGRLDILVNNAGALVGRGKIEETTLELWNATIAANLTSAFLVTRQAIPHLRKSAGDVIGSSSIINILSLSTQTGGANGAGAYAAAKGGMTVFTRTLAKELAPQVRANSVCPGVIETRHHAVASTPERMAEYRKQTPLGRNGMADEVAQAVLYLASSASSFTTGSLIDINGGRFLR